MMNTCRMRMLAVIAALCLLAGGALIWRACQIPVYTDAEVPGRLSVKLEKLPPEQRFDEWYQQLPNYETAHKKIYDWGQGVAALGLGLSLSAAWLAARKRFPRLCGKLPLTVAWLLAWAVQLPCVIWYYAVQQRRFDFPTWGDSVVIPIFQQTIMIGVGAVVTTLALLALTVNFAGTEKFSWRKPASFSEWQRLAWLLLWLALLLLIVSVSVPCGNVTYIIPCTLAATLLFTVAFGMEKSIPAPRHPLTVSAHDFARWFKYTLIHPALSLLLYFLSTGLPQGGTIGGVSFLLSMVGMLINLPGLYVVRLLMLMPGAREKFSPNAIMLFSIPVTWALLVAGVWLVYKWHCRRR